jgi:hypothetical protein
MARRTVVEAPPGYELDRRAAEFVMGWRVLPNDPRHFGQTVTLRRVGEIDLDDPSNYPHVVWYDGTEEEPSHHLLWSNPDAGGTIWAPSTEIASAWKIVERMKELGYDLTLTEGTRPHWRCLFRAGGEEPSASHGITAPHVICLAALRAIDARAHADGLPVSP